jgi:HK97 family phage portal protein
VTVLSRLFERAIKDEQLWGAWARGDDTAGIPYANPTGIRVDRTNAVQLSAVWACATLISDSISTLPVDTFFRSNGTRKPFRPRPSWVDEPNPEQDRAQWVSQQVMSLLFDGTTYVYTVRDRRGDVSQAWNVPPWMVTPKRLPGRSGIVYELRDPEIGFTTLDQSQMFHISGISWPGEIRGIAPIEAARVMFGSGLGAQEYAAKFYSQGMTHRGLVETEEDLTIEQARELKDDFKRQGGLRGAHIPPVLTAGAKWREMTVTPEQAQFLETRRFTVSEVARFFRVAPHMIGDIENSTSWGTGIEQQSIGFVTYTLRPWIERLEQAYSRYLLMLGPQANAFTKFNVNGLMRGDFKTRMEGYAVGRQWGWLSADDVLSLEDSSPLPNDAGKVYLEPINMRPAGTYEPPTPQGGTANG